MFTSSWLLKWHLILAYKSYKTVQLLYTFTGIVKKKSVSHLQHCVSGCRFHYRQVSGSGYMKQEIINSPARAASPLTLWISLNGTSRTWTPSYQVSCSFFCTTLQAVFHRSSPPFSVSSLLLFFFSPHLAPSAMNMDRFEKGPREILNPEIQKVRVKPSPQPAFNEMQSLCHLTSGVYTLLRPRAHPSLPWVVLMIVIFFFFFYVVVSP